MITQTAIVESTPGAIIAELRDANGITVVVVGGCHDWAAYRMSDASQSAHDVAQHGFKLSINEVLTSFVCNPEAIESYRR